MVDLVKIRKKAREQKESSAEITSEQSFPQPEREGHDQPAGGKAPASAPSGKVSGKNPGTSKRKSKQKERGSSGPEPSMEPLSTPTDSAPSDESPPEEISESPAVDAAPAADLDQEPKGESRLNRFKRTAGVIELGDAREDSEEQEAPSEDLLEVITFSLAGEQYAMDVDQLVEIIVPRASTRVPNASEEVIGIISLRGSIVTLLDLRKILRHPGRGEETEDTRIVVVQHESERIGFIVDKVLRVVKVERSAIEPHPVVSAAEHDDVVRGVFVSGDTITIYLDLQKIAGDQDAR